MSELTGLPPQQLPISKKTRAWRKKHLDWADSKTFFAFSPVRNSVIHKKINYDLVNGHLHLEDVHLILNPNNIKATYIPDSIQHYPMLNSKLEVLRGEELSREFNYRCVVTNPNALSDLEENKKKKAVEMLTNLIGQTQQQEEQEFNSKLDKINEYLTYEWQDIREITANALLEHYSKEYDFRMLFNAGFMDALIAGEEIYQCDIVSGEPVIERINPLKIRVFKSGYSNRIEDADIIIMEDYWSPGKVLDVYGKYLSKKDMDYIEKLPDHIGQSATDSQDNIDERLGFVNTSMIGEEFISDGYYFDPLTLFSNPYIGSLLPYDLSGNLRVLRVYWKSRKKIKEVKSYDEVTGEEIYTFYPETYIIDEDKGEEETIFYINEAWEGTKIGSDIYVNMRPRLIQYNRLSNPSRCHFGIIGTVYNLNDNKPFSLVDRMKPYSYLYDVIHDRLNKTIEKNWGKLVRLDLSKVPKGWDIEKWLYYARLMGFAIEDSFREGNNGASLGKLSGALNNNSSGVIDAEFGNSIQQYVNLLEYIENKLSEVSGISKQREGQISNRETVGGVERATLQSSYITEWFFATHNNLKKRVLECFLETAKIAYKGKSSKFNYILSDYSRTILDMDGNEFSEADYGLVVDDDKDLSLKNQKIEMLAQAAMQNQMLSFSSALKLFSSISMSEKQKIIEKGEREMQERTAQQQQQQMQIQQQQMQIQQQKEQAELKLKELELKQKEAELRQKDEANIRDNETKLEIAKMQTSANINQAAMRNNFDYADKSNQLAEKMRQFDDNMRLSKEKLNIERMKAKNKPSK